MKPKPPVPTTALAPAPAPPTTSLALPPSLVEAARGYHRKATAARTTQVYRVVWGLFEAWCSDNGQVPLPATPSTVAAYLAHRAQAGRRYATIALDLATISAAHKAAKLPTPRTEDVLRVLEGIGRDIGVRQRQAAPLLPSELSLIVKKLPDTLAGKRDRALLLLGFAGAFRRSELVALKTTDLTFEARGLRVGIARSKTDQKGEGTDVGVAFGAHPTTCPVVALKAWLEASGINNGYVFREITRWGKLESVPLSGRSVSRIVKQAVGLVRSSEDAEAFSGHSLRAGLVTTAARAHKNLGSIMAQTRHKTATMVERYIRREGIFDDNASDGIGL